MVINNLKDKDKDKLNLHIGFYEIYYTSWL